MMPGMNALMEQYASSGMFDIIGVPCNQFGLQEPGTNAEIPFSLQYVRPGDDYVPLFPLTEKSNVNGAEVGASELDLYTFMKAACPGTQTTIGETSRLYWSPVKQHDVTWNFEKFLMDKEGRPYKRYAPTFLPSDMEEDIEFLMSQ